MKNIFQVRIVAFLALALFQSLTINAQPNNSMDEKLFEGLHGHASLNVVVAIIGIILLGLFITLFRLERKVSKLEKQINK
ncbi:MAG: hypothetical protein NT084_12060 [Bacteroidetes bacterium]|jgi:uncharacterized integral membrane protein|nr:hypothetical protein [Bacteroidota bacterium]